MHSLERSLGTKIYPFYCMMESIVLIMLISYIEEQVSEEAMKLKI